MGHPAHARLTTRLAAREAGLLARGSSAFLGLPSNLRRQWFPKKLSAYSRGGGRGIALPRWVGASTFPFSSGSASSRATETPQSRA